MHALKTIAFGLCLAPAMFGAQVIGLNQYSGDFSTQSAAISFVAFNQSASSLTSIGTVVGLPSFATLSASGTNFLNGNLSAQVQMNISVGFGSSFFGAFAESYSGVVQITNSSNSVANFFFTDTYTYSISAIGPDNAGISFVAQLLKFNSQTQTFEAIGSTSSGIGTGQSVTVCQAGCGPVQSSFQVAANSSDLYQLYVRLRASGDQLTTGGVSSDVPEPSTLGLCAAAGLAVLIRGLVRRT